MLSTDTLIRTRGLSAAQTWAQDLSRIINKKTGERSKTAKLEIYADSDFLRYGENKNLGVNTITMKNVDDNVYPPQKKSFSMVKYMADHYLDDYEWFVRFDDDAYLNWELLEKFLRTVDSSQPVMIGAAGYGKDADDFVEEGMNYCMGGPGVIFSRETLKRLAPHLGTCLHNLMTNHEDVELGRCVYKSIGVTCTNSWEATKLFWQNFKRAEDITHLDVGYFSNIVEAPKEVLKKAVILHANKDSAYQFKLFVDILKSRIDTLQENNLKLGIEVRRMEELIGSSGPSMQQISGEIVDEGKAASAILNQLTTTNKIETSKWIQIMRGHIYKYKREDECNRKVENPWVDVVSDNIREAAKVVYKDQHLLGKITKIEVPLIYHMSDRNGAYYIADLAMRHLRYNGYHGTAELSTVKSRVIMNQVYSKSYISEATYTNGGLLGLNTKELSKLITSKHKLNLPNNFIYSQAIDSTPVHFIVPFSGRPDNLKRFLKYLDENLLSKGVDIHLVVVLFIEGPDDEGLPFVTRELEGIQDRNPEREFMLIKVSFWVAR